MKWLTFCPVEGMYFDYANPLATCFRARSHELGSFRKVIVGGKFAERCKVSNGNHYVSHPEFRTKPVQLDYELQHVPVRSSEQIVRKVLLGNYAFSLTSGRKKKEAYHWRDMLSDIRKNDYSLSNQALLDLALTYGDNGSDCQLPNVIPDRLMDICDGCTIEYTNLARINLVKSIDAFTMSLVDSCAPPALQNTHKGFLNNAAKRLKRVLFRAT
jgi:hypothetical protein